MRELSPLFGMGTLELGTHYHCTPTSHTRDTVRRVDLFITISPSRTNVLPDSCDFRLCKGGILWGEQSFTVKEGSKKGLKKEWRPIANRQLLYQSSLLPHFLPHGATVTVVEHGCDSEIRHSWAFETITKKLEKRLWVLEIQERIQTVQTRALLRSTRILRRVLESLWDLLSLELPYKPPFMSGVKNSQGVNNDNNYNIYSKNISKNVEKRLGKLEIWGGNNPDNNTAEISSNTYEKWQKSS